MKTHHAQARMQQRGVRNDTIDFILEHADCCVPRGNNREALSVSRTRLNKMCHEGHSVTQCDRAIDIILIIDAATGMIITVMHAEKGSRGRAYQRKPSRARGKQR
tara:strand:- start:470 stop:784 length:315 start_codon:yes stop_codon:yes gene_type:complete